MTIKTVSVDTLAQIAFESGNVIHMGRHEADVQVDGVLYVARIGGDAA